MARGSGNAPRGNGSSKIRFIMLEADLSDGDLTQVTQAITNALRPTSIVHRFVSSAAQSLGDGAPAENVITEEASNTPETALEHDVTSVQTQRPTPRGPRKYPSPKVLSDVDLVSGGMPFEEFAQKKNPTETSKKFLTVAAWFKTYRDLDSVTTDHVYTCYRKMGWGTGIKDFGQPFRDLKSQGWGDLRLGVFSINHIGEDVVNKMGAE